MKKYTKNEIWDMINPLVNENLLLAEDKEKSNDYLIGMLEANIRLIKLQQRILDL